MSTERIFNAQFQGDYIYEFSYHTAAKKVGVALELYENLHSEYSRLVPLFNQYQEKLIELGEISLPKTPEEIIKEQAKQLEENRKILEKIYAKLSVLEKEKSDGPVWYSDQSSSRQAETARNFVGGGEDSNGNAEESTIDTKIS